MSLRYALLGALSLRPMSGYDLKKFFHRNVGLFWNASIGQIYSHLHRLEDEGLLSQEGIIQDGRPNKKVYSLTEQGQQELTVWLSDPMQIPDYKDGFQLRFFFADHIEPDKIREHLLGMRDYLRPRQEHLSRILAGEVPAISPITRQAATYGHRYYQVYLDWIEETLGKLDNGELTPHLPTS